MDSLETSIASIASHLSREHADHQRLGGYLILKQNNITIYYIIYQPKKQVKYINRKKLPKKVEVCVCVDTHHLLKDDQVMRNTVRIEGPEIIVIDNNKKDKHYCACISS